jgi:hypothetical protein
MSYLDDWYAVVARNIGGGSNKQFFHQGYGDMVAASKLYSEVIGAVTRGKTKPLQVVWGDLERSEPSVFSGCLGSGQRFTPTFQEASFESPAASYLPPVSQQGKFLFVWRVGTDGSPTPPPTKIAVHLPTTGDQFYWFRKQIALDLLKHDIASVILMFPYYSTRKPHHQYAHILPSVASFITQISAGVTESAGIALWTDKEFPNCTVVFTGVSLGGSVANVAAIVAAAGLENGEKRVGSAPVVATSSATSFLTGVLHSRIAWDVLAAAPGDCADALKQVLEEDHSGKETAEESKQTLTLENGKPLNEAETKLAETMECLSLPKIVRLMSNRRHELNLEMPKLGSVVQVSASGDRFVGKHQSELFGTLREVCTESSCERRDITGGHISTLLPSKRSEVIVPAIVEAFEKLNSGQREEGNGRDATVTAAPMSAAQAQGMRV